MRLARCRHLTVCLSQSLNGLLDLLLQKHHILGFRGCNDWHKRDNGSLGVGLDKRGGKRLSVDGHGGDRGPDRLVGCECLHLGFAFYSLDKLDYFDC